MAVSFACPKCSQKLTLSASKPGDWLDCPSCEASIQVPGAPAARPAPKPPARDAAPAQPAPKPPPRPKPAPVPAASAAPKKWWADRGVLVGAGAGLALVVGVAVALSLRKPADQEQAKAEPPPPVVAPTPTPTPAPKPTPNPKPTPAPKPPPPQPDPVKPDSKPAPQQPIEPPKTTQPQQTGIAVAPPPRKARDYPPPLLVEAEAPLDQFGNPIGKDQGLARQDEFKGQRIVFWSAWKATPDEDPRVYFSDKNPLWKALADKGFTVRREFGKFDPKWLKDADQLWILSGDAANVLDLDGVLAVSDFVDAGKGLLLLADNDPFCVEADVLTLSLFGAGVVGDYEGTKIAHVRNRKLTAADIKKFKGDYAVDDHPLLTGVNFVYEGITISHIKLARAKDLEVVLKASDGKPVVAVSTDPKKRVVIDCGFTRYWHSPDAKDNFIEKTAGTVRLAQNIAAFLAGKDAPKKP